MTFFFRFQLIVYTDSFEIWTLFQKIIVAAPQLSLVEEVSLTCTCCRLSCTVCDWCWFQASLLFATSPLCHVITTWCFMVTALCDHAALAHTKLYCSLVKQNSSVCCGLPWWTKKQGYWFIGHVIACCLFIPLQQVALVQLLNIVIKVVKQQAAS